jgi:hypothetical protein
VLDGKRHVRVRPGNDAERWMIARTDPSAIAESGTARWVGDEGPFVNVLVVA